MIYEIMGALIDLRRLENIDVVQAYGSYGLQLRFAGLNVTYPMNVNTNRPGDLNRLQAAHGRLMRDWQAAKLLSKMEYWPDPFPHGDGAIDLGEMVVLEKPMRDSKTEYSSRSSRKPSTTVTLHYDIYLVGRGRVTVQILETAPHHQGMFEHAHGKLLDAWFGYTGTPLKGVA